MTLLGVGEVSPQAITRRCRAKRGAQPESHPNSVLLTWLGPLVALLFPSSLAFCGVNQYQFLQSLTLFRVTLTATSRREETPRPHLLQELLFEHIGRSLFPVGGQLKGMACV